MPDPTTSPALKAAARQLAVAEIARSQAQTALGEAQASLDAVLGRVDQKARDRAAIAARRASGVEQTGDAGELELIAVDLENLGELRQEAEAVLATRRATFDAAQARHTAAIRELELVQAREDRDLLAQVAAQHEAGLLATLTQLDAAKERLGERHRAAWAPSTALTDALHSLRIRGCVTVPL